MTRRTTEILVLAAATTAGGIGGAFLAAGIGRAAGVRIGPVGLAAGAAAGAALGLAVGTRLIERPLELDDDIQLDLDLEDTPEEDRG